MKEFKFVCSLESLQSFNEKASSINEPSERWTIGCITNVPLAELALD